MNLFSPFYFPASGEAVVTRCRPFSPPILAFNFYRAHPTVRRFVLECLLTHALALSASQFVHKKKSLRIIRVCTRGDLNSRNRSTPGSRTTRYATGATRRTAMVLLVACFHHNGSRIASVPVNVGVSFLLLCSYQVF